MKKIVTLRLIVILRTLRTVAYRGGNVCGVQSPTPKIVEAHQNRATTQRDCENLKIVEFRKPAHKHVRKKGSKIIKLSRFAIVLH